MPSGEAPDAVRMTSSPVRSEPPRAPRTPVEQGTAGCGQRRQSQGDTQAEQGQGGGGPYVGLWWGGDGGQQAGGAGHEQQSREDRSSGTDPGDQAPGEGRVDDHWDGQGEEGRTGEQRRVAAGLLELEGEDEQLAGQAAPTTSPPASDPRTTGFGSGSKSCRAALIILTIM